MSDVPGFVIEEFVAVSRQVLVGFCRVRFPSGVIFHDTAIYSRNGVAWARPGGRALLDRDERQLRDHRGHLMWAPIVSFASKETERRFSDAVIEALRRSHPAVLAAVEGKV